MAWGESRAAEQERRTQRVIAQERQRDVADALRHRDAELRNDDKIVLPSWDLLTAPERFRWLEMAAAAENARG